MTPDHPTATTPVQVSTSPHRKSAGAKKTVAAEVPPPPAPPPTLDQLPPTPPQVRFQNGELTIDAHNSTLAQVLRAVQAKTGASIDIPGSAGSDRVATLIGPGQPRDVLNTLLNGSKFDYVILGVAGDPGAVQKVILTPRQAGSTTTAQNNPTPQPQPEEPDEGPVAESEPEYQNQNPQQPVRPGGFRHPGLPIQPPFQQNGAAPEQEQEQNNGGKSPEQLMQELQQMQQQQQQIQEQLNPANRQPPQ